MIGLMAGMVGSRFLGAGLGFLSQIMLARALPVEDVGIVLLAMSAAAFFSLAAIGGYSFLALTQLPRLATHGRPHLLRAFHQTVLTDSLLVGVLISILLAALLLWLPVSNGLKMALLFGWLSSPASGLLRYNSSAASSDRQFKLSYVPDFLVRPFLFLLALVAGLALGIPLTAMDVLIAFVAVTVVTALGQAWLMGDIGLTVADFKWPRAAFAKPIRRRAAALTIVSAVAFAFADIVTLVAGFVLPESDVAVVGIAIRLAAIAGFVLQAGQTFILPDLTQALRRREERTARQLLVRVNLTTLAVIGASLVGALLFGKFALSIFGAEYVRGAGVLVLFLVAQSVRALGGMNQHILSINGQQMRTAGACVVALVIFVCLAVLLCRNWGLMGMGYAAVLAEMAWLMALAAQAQKLCGRRGDLLWLARTAA